MSWPLSPLEDKMFLTGNASVAAIRNQMYFPVLGNLVFVFCRKSQ